jgi:hypothetical protein
MKYPRHPFTTNTLSPIIGISTPYNTLYNTKIVKSGTRIEIAQTNKQNSKRWITKPRSQSVIYSDNLQKLTSPDTSPRRADNLHRAKQKVIRLAHANHTNKMVFVTLTYKANQQDRTTALQNWQYMIKQIERDTKQNIPWLRVIEYQERGAIHFHALVNMPFIPHKKFLSRYWRHGGVWLSHVQTPDKASNYCAKYITKAPGDLKHIRLYSASHNLNQPQHIYDVKFVTTILNYALKNKYNVVTRTNPIKHKFDTSRTIVYTTIDPPV